MPMRDQDAVEVLEPKSRLQNLALCSFPTIHQEAVLFDFRTIQPGEDSLVEKALKGLIAKTRRSENAKP